MLLAAVRLRALGLCARLARRFIILPARPLVLSFVPPFVRSLADQAWQSLLIIVIINNCKRGTSEGKRERKKSFIRNNSALVFVLVEAAAHYYATRA